jgi:hypothetical protein
MLDVKGFGVEAYPSLIGLECGITIRPAGLKFWKPILSLNNLKFSI